LRLRDSSSILDTSTNATNSNLCTYHLIGQGFEFWYAPHKLNLWNMGKLPKGVSIKDLKKTHPSRPRNELLADVFFKAGLIEAWGRGTIKIIDECKKAGLPEPRFREESSGFSVTFSKPKGTEKGVERIGKAKEKIIEQVRRKFGESSEKILRIILVDKNVSAQKIAEQLNISSRAVEKQIAKLKKQGILKRIGPAKGGYWKVIGI